MTIGFDVFLSHNSKDKPAVRELAEALRARGLTVWLDEWELIPGRPWQEALEAVIQTARASAVLVGKDGLGPWEDAEVRGCLSEFVARKLPVIPVLLPGAPAEPDLPFFLKRFTWVDLRAGLTEEGLDRLHWGITGRKPDRSVPRESQPRQVGEPDRKHLQTPPFKDQEGGKKRWASLWIIWLAWAAVAAAGMVAFTLLPNALNDLEKSLRAMGYEPSVGLTGPPPGTVVQVARRGTDGRLQSIHPPKVVLLAEQCFPGKTPSSAPFPLPHRMVSRKTALQKARALKLLREFPLSIAKSWEVSLTNPHLQTFAKPELSQSFSPGCLIHLQTVFDRGEAPAQYATILEAVVVDGMSLLVEWPSGLEGRGRVLAELFALSKKKTIQIHVSIEERGKTRLDIQGPLILAYRTASMEPVGERPQ